MDPEDISHVVNADVVQPKFAKPLRQPRSAPSLSKRRRRNAGHFQLPMRQLRLLRSKPVKRGPNLGRSRKPRHFLLDRGKHIRYIAAGTEGHGARPVILQRQMDLSGCLWRVARLRVVTVTFPIGDFPGGSAALYVPATCTHSRISASVKVWSEDFARAKTRSITSSVAAIPCRSSQKCTLDFPLIGPTSMICSSPNTWEGTPEYTALASSTSFFL